MPHDMSDALDRFLAEERMTPFGWRRSNCCIFLARWWGAATGDWRPFQEWADRCATDAEARDIIASHGGLPAVLASICGASMHPGEARRGDIGLLAVDDWHIGLISTGTMWAGKKLRGGVTMMRRGPDIAWRVPWPR